MKILLLHQFFKTPEAGGAIRSYYLAKALVEANHHVVIITTHNEKTYKLESIAGVEVHYLPIHYKNSFGFLQRSWAFISYAIKTSGFSGKFKHFDKCYAISVPLTVGLIARWNQIRFGIPYVFEVGDLWPDAPIQMGYVKNYFFRKALLSLEKYIYRHAEFVVALSDPIQEAILRKIANKTVHVIPNMADCDYYYPQEKNEALVTKYNVAGKFVVSYVGAIGVANGLEFFLKCIQISAHQKLPIHFILCGEGAMRESLSRQANQLKLENLSILPFVNRDGVKEILNITDSIFVSFMNFPILETGSPNKLFDGLAAGKVVINNFGGWIREEIKENHCGFSVDPKEPEDFIKKITPFISDKDLLIRYQQSARALAERKYSRKLLSERFVMLLT